MSDDARRPTRPTPLSGPATLARLGVIGAVVVVAAGAFAYTGGWLSPARLTQDRVITAFEQADGSHPGFRRNHAKGLCATGTFQASGQATALSHAVLFTPGRYPVVARFAFAGGMPFIPDAPDEVRSLALRIMPPGAEEWRTGMIDIPVFPFSTTQAFYDQLVTTVPDPATGKPDPARMQAFVKGHPEFLAAVGLIKARQQAPGFAQTTYNGLHTFRFISAAGAVTPVRWSVVPADAPAPIAAATAHDPNAQFDALIAQETSQPLRWHLMLAVGRPEETTNPTLPWPADRPQVDAGTITLDHLASEDGGPCTDVNYDPTVLPAGIALSDDPIPAARAAAYALSFRKREGERGVKPPSAVTAAEVAAGGRS